MTKVNIIEEYKTSLGRAVTTRNIENLKVGQVIEIDGKNCEIKSIIFPTNPNKKNIFSLIVE